MKSNLLATGFYALLAAEAAIAEYIWPSAHDELEDIYMLQSGYVHKGFIDAISPCSFGKTDEGSQSAAEWVRAAFHDMATHNASAGTGGLDASAMFETERAENKGAFLNNTFSFFSSFYSTRAGAADLLALAVVSATSVCGGPQIPFTVGRTDATAAGPFGVPSPEQDIDTHIALFQQAGFDTEDMITLVACGHTLGGVHGEDFPEITGDATPGSRAFFENGTESFFQFDNKVVTEFLDGTTVNPLVVGLNETENSDKRVFMADGTNATMEALSDAAVFQSKCASIFQTMIETVPAGTSLTQMEVVDIKPYVNKVALTSNGSIALEGRVRVRITERTYDDLAVQLSYVDGSSGSNKTIATTRIDSATGTSVGLFGESFGWFEFSTDLDASSAGISSFNIHLTTQSTGVVDTFTNGGSGFPVEDSVLYQPVQSCMNTTEATDGTFAVTITAAVRNSTAQSVAVEMVHQIAQQGVVLPKLQVESVAMEATGQTVGGYTLYSVQTPLESSSWSTTFDIVATDASGNERRVEFLDTTDLASKDCQAL